MNKHRKQTDTTRRIAITVLSAPLVLGVANTGVAWADEPSDDTDQSSTEQKTGKPAKPSKTSAPTAAPSAEPSSEPAPGTSVAEPDAPSQTSAPKTAAVEPGVVSANEVEVRATQTAEPAAEPAVEPAAEPAVPAEPAEPAVEPAAEPATPAEPAVPQADPVTPADSPAAKPTAVVEAMEVVVDQPPEPRTLVDVAAETLTANPPAAVVVPEIPAAQPVEKDVPQVKADLPEATNKVAANVLAALGLNPFAGTDPGQPPPDSPAMWAMLAMARKQPEVEEPSMFGRMFPDLEPLNQQLTVEQLKAIACGDCKTPPTAGQGMAELGAIANPNGTTGGITFFGQFIDHDLTLDSSANPTSDVDPTTLTNERTFAFDLDSVYGGGPSVNPELYTADGLFKIGVASDGVTPDLPRNPDGSAILVEHRNDENLIIAQIHLSFLRLHNELMDEGMTFDEAHDTVVESYRYVVLNDYLPQIVGQDAVDKALMTPQNKGFFQPGKDTPFTPVEFAVAAFRFGHSQVRNAYNINDTSNAVAVFSLTPGVQDLRGGRVLPADPLDPTKNFVIDFDNFFSELPQDGGPLLISRAIDTKISASLFQLPIPGAEGGGSNVLGFRNLTRAKFYNMPSFESVAEAMGVPPLIDPATGEPVDPVFEDGTPLWFGILREAEMTCGDHTCAVGEQGGGELGPVGGGIVAEVFVDLLRLDGGTKNIRTPNLPDVSGGDFRIGDLLVAADQPPREEPQPPAEQPCRDREVRYPAQERPGRHRFHQQLHRATDPAPGRHRVYQQLHRADDPAPGRHRLYQQLHGVHD